MMTLIVGTPDSGKSLLAESLVMEQARDLPRYYIATMLPYGKEGELRIQKHRRMREGKGFCTLEWPTKLAKHLTEVDLSSAAVLLECMSNLVGNEMHSTENNNLSEENLQDQIIADVNALQKAAGKLYVVTNEFPIEDESYDEETKAYVQLVAAVNEKLMALADSVYRCRKE